MTEQTKQIPLNGDRVGDALAFAARAHADQFRKGKPEPYLSHILTVAGLVVHYGGDEDQIIAAALHDAAEDRGGEEMLTRIRECFGERVAAIVRDCSDALPADGEDKPPWKERKEAYLEHLKQGDEHGSHLVSACDKLANLRDLVEDAEGPGALPKFNAKIPEIVWYYESLGEIFEPEFGFIGTDYHPMLKRFKAAVNGN